MSGRDDVQKTSSMLVMAEEGGLKQNEFMDKQERFERSRSYGISTSCIAAVRSLIDHGR